MYGHVNAPHDGMQAAYQPKTGKPKAKKADDRPASAGQLTYIAKLRAGKQMTAEQVAAVDVLMPKLAEPGGLGVATVVIDSMKDLPWIPKPKAALGVYRFKGDVYVVVQGQNGPYAKALVRAPGEELSKHDAGWRGEWYYTFAPGMVSELVTAERLDLPEGTERSRAATVAKLTANYIEQLF